MHDATSCCKCDVPLAGQSRHTVWQLHKAKEAQDNTSNNASTPEDLGQTFLAKIELQAAWHPVQLLLTAIAV